jgi:uncharacterized protein
MTTALALLAVVAADPSRMTTGIGLAVFGLGFGLVTQVLLVAVQNSVDRHELGTATATTNFFRALGGAVGAAVLGAVFAARAGVHASQSNVQAIDPVLRADIVEAVQTVFVVATPLAALALIVVLRLPEAPLQTRRAAAHGEGQPGRARAAAGGSQIVLNARRPAMPTFNDLRDERVILLTTFRADHSPVATPVNFGLGEGHAYLRTWASSGKSRRIARNPKVTVAPSAYSGKATGPAVPALARALTGEEARQAGKLIDRKYPIIQRLLVPLGHRLRRLTPVIFELMLDETEQSPRRVAG